MNREKDKKKEGFVHVDRFLLVCKEPFQSYDVVVEVGRGKAWQIYRTSFTLEDGEMDIRAKLGIALEELGASLQRSAGDKLVSVMADGKVSVK